MTGNAAIRGNAAKNGGGISISGNSGSAKAEMKGGEVSGNKAAYGGGVYVFKGRTFTLSGGSVARNEAEFVGGGVYVESGAAFTQSRGVVVSGNAAGDGEGEDVFKQ
jgi:hypothetical protein